MNPIRKRRLWLVLALVVAAGIATALVSMALQRNVAYLYTPSEVLRGEAGDHARFRLGGMVAADSFTRAPGSMEAHFKVDDGDAMLPVVFTGILPDLFREKQAVIATGQMRGGTFVAEEVLAKHDETYMPKEVADKMAEAHQKHHVEAGDVEAGDVETGDVEAGDVEAGDVEAGDVEAGDVEAGDVEAGDVETSGVEEGGVGPSAGTTK